MTIQERIGLRIYKRRREVKMTASKLAERAHIHRNTVSRMEAGESMSIESLWAVCGVLGMTLDSAVKEIKPSSAVQLELWPNKRARLYACSKLPSATRKGSNEMRALPDGLGSFGPRAAEMPSRAPLLDLRNGTDGR